MLNIVGGKKSLEPLKVQLKKKLKKFLMKFPQQPMKTRRGFPNKLQEDIEIIVDKRLEELTSDHVKIIMKEMIQKHLGWLVVWGGVLVF